MIRAIGRLLSRISPELVLVLVKMIQSLPLVEAVLGWVGDHWILKEAIFFYATGLATEGFQNGNHLFTLKIFISDVCNANIVKSQC